MTFTCLNNSLLQNNTFSRLSLRQNLIVLEEVSSTNDYLKELLSNIKPLAEATAIMARHQTRGKGQRGSVWTTSPGENLTFSFNLYPTNLEVAKSFNLNMLLCLAIRRWLLAMNLPATVKWPNDIYINNKKIGGVLVENQLSGHQIHTSIIGIGLNINQLTFPQAIAHRVTSVRCELPSDQTYSIENCCLDLLQSIGYAWSKYDLQNTDQLLAAYTDVLFRKDVSSGFIVNGQEVQGIISGVNSSGKLCVMIRGEAYTFDLKEIAFII